MVKRVKGRKPTKGELQAQVTMHRHEAWVRIMQSGWPWIGSVFITLFIYKAVVALAGHVTITDIKVIANATWGESGTAPAWYIVGVSVVLGVGGLWFGHRERRLRKDTIERMHIFQELWEKSQDPLRTSSNLTPRGETRPEDK